MQGIVIATLVVGVIGLLIGIALVATGKKFYVEVDERETAVRECLPGNNCGACGYAGCDAVAAAIVKGEAPVNACPAESAEMVEKIGQIMGVQAEESVKKVAFVRCAGTCGATAEKCNYIGIHDCRSAVLSGISVWECDYGCLGFGSCVSACAMDAIHVEEGVAVVDREKCIGCGMCSQACPWNMPRVDTETGVSTKCISCGRCAEQCPNGAIKFIDWEDIAQKPHSPKQPRWLVMLNFTSSKAGTPPAAS